MHQQCADADDCVVKYQIHSMIHQLLESLADASLAEYEDDGAHQSSWATDELF
jgi:hypothetical protein